LFAPSFQDLPELNIHFLVVNKYEGVSSFAVFFKNLFFSASATKPTFRHFTMTFSFGLKTLGACNLMYFILPMKSTQSVLIGIKTPKHTEFCQI